LQFSLLCGGFFFLVENTLPTTQADDATPTLAEIAKANEATWNAITSVDVEYLSNIQCMQDGELTRDCQTKRHWSKSGNLERLRKYPIVKKIDTAQFGHLSGKGWDAEFHDYFFNGIRTVRQAGDSDPKRGRLEWDTEFHDYLFDGKTVRHLEDSDPKKEKKDLPCNVQTGLNAEISTSVKRRPYNNDNYVEPLRYLWRDGLNDLSLSKIIDSWKVSLQGKQTASNGDTLWLLHAEYPPKNAKDESAGSYLNIQVNANKGFLVQKVLRYATSTIDEGPAWVYSTEEVKQFQDCGHGVFFPQKTQYDLLANKKLDPKNNYCMTITATKLSVNSPMPAKAFDFRFPENAVVLQDAQEKKSIKVFIWGPDNRPAKEFTATEFSTYVDKLEQEELRQRIEKNLASKNPEDIFERGTYYVQTKKYDEAIAAFSEAIAVAPPKTDEKITCALGYRAMIYLLYKQDFEKAAVDFTKLLRLAPKDAEGVYGLYYARGLAYAHQDATLDKSIADFTEGLQRAPDQDNSDPAGIIPIAYVVRSAARAHQGHSDTAIVDATKAIEMMQTCKLPEQHPERFADAYAVRCCIYEKTGEHTKATADREIWKQLRQKKSRKTTNDYDDDIFAAIHRCLLHLLPTLENP
jgi:tetratricopeptide (TPR) repeat protein